MTTVRVGSLHLGMKRAGMSLRGMKTIGGGTKKIGESLRGRMRPGPRPTLFKGYGLHLHHLRHLSQQLRQL